MDFTAVERLGLVLVRPGVLIALSPALGGSYAPMMVRIGLIVLVGLALAPIVAIPDAASAAGSVGLGMIVLRETLIGLALTFSVRIVIAGAELGGYLAGFQLGFSYASLVDPQSGARNGVMEALYANIALLVFLGVNGHHQMLQALAASYGALPVGGGIAAGDMASLVARTLGLIFIIGVRIAAPVVLVLIVVELALGLVTRAAPQLNLMVVGAPVRLLVGLFVLGATLAVVPDVVLTVIDPAMRLASKMASALAGQ